MHGKSDPLRTDTNQPAASKTGDVRVEKRACQKADKLCFTFRFNAALLRS